ncbi:MAG: hypothetical protein JRH07_14930 [Deltaproteobacteria bacterium]|nr:hypothetical protein [Deltaproteobacteria bacterium]MBW2123117.1 hypothetical protein [Deltaproteobacteria bacterium]
MPRGRHFFGRGFWWRGMGAYPYPFWGGRRGTGRYWFGMPAAYGGWPYGPVPYYPYGIAPYPF